MSAIYKLPLVLDPQPEGGFTVTCPILPELITEGETIEEALDNVSDALAAVIEAYEDLRKPMPAVPQYASTNAPLWIETAVTVP